MQIIIAYSYKRLVENYWAPVSVSWGMDSRHSAVRVIAPPSASASATRLEMVMYKLCRNKRKKRGSKKKKGGGRLRKERVRFYLFVFTRLIVHR
jgi:hypothetical protein